MFLADLAATWRVDLIPLWKRPMLESMWAATCQTRIEEYTAALWSLSRTGVHITLLACPPPEGPPSGFEASITMNAVDVDDMNRSQGKGQEVPYLGHTPMTARAYDR